MLNGSGADVGVSKPSRRSLAPFCVQVFLALLVFALGNTSAEGVVHAATYTYDAPPLMVVKHTATTAVVDESPLVSLSTADSAERSPVGSGTSTTPEPRSHATNTVNPRDVHGELADTDVDVDHVKSEGDLYIQDDGQLVRVLDNGNGTSDVVVYDPSNPTCAPTTKIKNMPNRQVQSRIDSGRWS